MKALQLIGLAAIGIAMLGAGSVLADDLPLPADPAQQRENMRSMSSEERTAYREQLQERMRNMTPEEQKLMRETSSDRRAQMESKQSTQGSGMRRGSGGGGGGRGMGGGRNRSANEGMTP